MGLGSSGNLGLCGRFSDFHHKLTVPNWFDSGRCHLRNKRRCGPVETSALGSHTGTYVATTGRRDWDSIFLR